MVCAPTAVAAEKIGGRTIHSLLKLNPKSKEEDKIPLPPHPFLKLFIMDEVSMCSGELFERAELRLRQLMRRDIPFGGCTVVVTGDLLQIPPVGDKWIFKSTIWQEHVTFIELKKSMRQEADPEFAEMLKRWRVGEKSSKDIAFLQSRTVGVGSVEFFAQKYQTGTHSMLLAHTNNLQSYLNREITDRLFSNENRLSVCEVDHEGGKKRKRLDFHTGTGGQVMITRNLNQKLMNGSLCTVKSYATNDSQTIDLKLRLLNGDEVDMPVVVSDTGTEKWLAKYHMAPAFASTYHKAQGLTLDSVFLFADQHTPPALFYVGASRVRTRDALHIMSRCCWDSINPNQEALQEYTRLQNL